MSNLLFVTQYYHAPNFQRQVEIDQCLWGNIGSKLFDKVGVVCPDGIRVSDCGATAIRQTSSLPGAHHASGRPTFRQLFAFAAELLSAGDVAVVANSDILFDASIGLARTMDPKEAWCLARADNLMPSGQDAWVMAAPLPVVPCDFPMGYPGCDGRLAWELSHLGKRVVNPSLSVRCYHRHESKLRWYPADQIANRACPDYVPSPYLYIMPSILGYFGQTKTEP